jgi:hypothetical protein
MTPTNILIAISTALDEYNAVLRPVNILITIGEIIDSEAVIMTH